MHTGPGRLVAAAKASASSPSASENSIASQSGKDRRVGQPEGESCARLAVLPKS